MLRIKVLHLLPAVFLGITGLGVAALGSSYQVGSLTAMGPGFMPVALGCCLIVLAVSLLAGELRHPSLTDPAFPLRPVLWVGSGIVVWALLINVLGFFPACVVQLVLSSLALQQQGWRSIALMVLCMTLVSYVVFVMLLGVPVPAFGS